jgi:hypothetical protein
LQHREFEPGDAGERHDSLDGSIMDGTLEPALAGKVTGEACG